MIPGSAQTAICEENGNSENSRLTIFAQDSYHTALNLHFRCGQDDRKQLGIGRLEPHFAARLAVETLQSGFTAAHQSYHDFARIRHLSRLDYDVVAVEDVILNHGAAGHLQNETAAGPRELAQGK